MALGVTLEYTVELSLGATFDSTVGLPIGLSQQSTIDVTLKRAVNVTFNHAFDLAFELAFDGAFGCPHDLSANDCSLVLANRGTIENPGYLAILRTLDPPIGLSFDEPHEFTDDVPCGTHHSKL